MVYISKLFITLTIALMLFGCAEEEKLLVIECINKDNAKKWDNPVFIWYKSNNSLDGSDGSSTPHQYSNDFKSIFFREFVREIAIHPDTERRQITFDEFKKDLLIERTWRPEDGKPYYVKPNTYSCKVLEDNR